MPCDEYYIVLQSAPFTRSEQNCEKTIIDQSSSRVPKVLSTLACLEYAEAVYRDETQTVAVAKVMSVTCHKCCFATGCVQPGPHFPCSCQLQLVLSLAPETGMTFWDRCPDCSLFNYSLIETYHGSLYLCFKQGILITLLLEQQLFQFR